MKRVGRQGRLRVAMVSTPFVSVPPVQYGGTELIVAELVDGLTERGVEVTLFATGDSRGGFKHRCPVRAWFQGPTWPPTFFKELEHCAFAARELLRDGGFDLVHAHSPTMLPLVAMLPVPTVYTVHHPYSEEYCTLYQHIPAVTYVSISRRQEQLCGPFTRGEVIHHGLDPARYRLAPVRPDSVAFLGRLAEVKAPHVAIDAARRAGLRIRIGGQPHEEDAAYFAEQVRPRLSQRHVDYLGEVGHEAKVELLSTARALVFPIAWEEPFGLVVIEAMLCGCPVVAYARGAVPEIVDEGVTGFIARDEAQLASILVGPASPARFDRERCRAYASERFGAGRMVDDYLRLYEARLREARLEHEHEHEPAAGPPANG